MFIHDSLHSEQNGRFEVDRAFAALRPGGAIVVDDIDRKWGVPNLYAGLFRSPGDDLRGRATSARREALQQEGTVWHYVEGAD